MVSCIEFEMALRPPPGRHNGPSGAIWNEDLVFGPLLSQDFRSGCMGFDEQPPPSFAIERHPPDLTDRISRTNVEIGAD